MSRPTPSDEQRPLIGPSITAARERSLIATETRCESLSSTSAASPTSHLVYQEPLITFWRLPLRRASGPIRTSKASTTMYHSSDPRNTLSSNGSRSSDLTTKYGRPQLLELHNLDASAQTPAGSRTWLVRTSNYLVAYHEVLGGDAVVLLPAVADRLVLVPHDQESITVELHSRGPGNAPVTVEAASILVVPGPARLTAHTAATIIEAVHFDDLSAAPRALNEDFYTVPVPGVALRPGRRVPGLQHAITVYSMSDYRSSPDRFGRIVCSSNIMANLLEIEDGPRDETRLSPHSHDDFEQCCITTRGRYVHHWRTPWTPDSTTWRDDMHPVYDSPGIAIIPPGVMHTANSTTAGANQMIDLFAPPRADFTDKGWVLNAEDCAL